MRKILEKLTKLELTLANQEGPFDLFALFLREDGFDKWDLVASAAWVEKDYDEALDCVTRKLDSLLSTEELLMISKVVLIDEFDERVKNIQKAITVEHRPTELREMNFFGLRIELAYVITSKVQADRFLLRQVWEVLTEMWRNGERAVYSGDVLKALRKKNERVPVGAMRRAFEFLMTLRCIRAARFVDRDGIKEHGAMTITSVIPHCSQLETYFATQDRIDLLGLNGEVFHLGHEKWLLLVDDVVEHQANQLTYHLHFINENAPLQERKLDLTISSAALATEKKDRHKRPERLREWMFGWLFEKRPIHALNFDEEMVFEHA